MEWIYKVEIPANWYDILCSRASRALNVFLGREPLPLYKLPAAVGRPLTMTVEPETAVRLYIACAILRNRTLDDRSYNSCLDLQDRMHHNICRRRMLVAIGTHDLDTITPLLRHRAIR